MGRNKEKQRWLYRYRHAKHKQASLQLTRDEVLSEMTSISPNLSGMPAAHTGEDKIAEAYERLEAASVKLAEAIVECQIIMDEVSAAIDAVKDERMQEILRYHYINEMPFPRIAEIMQYSIRRIFDLYAAALDEVCIELH